MTPEQIKHTHMHSEKEQKQSPVCSWNKA